MTPYRSRKFISALMALGGAQWGLLVELLPAVEYRLIVLGTVGAYIVGNVAQKAIESKGSTSAAP